MFVLVECSFVDEQSKQINNLQKVGKKLKSAFPPGRFLSSFSAQNQPTMYTLLHLTLLCSAALNAIVRTTTSYAKPLTSAKSRRGTPRRLFQTSARRRGTGNKLKDGLGVLPLSDGTCELQKGIK